MVDFVVRFSNLLLCDIWSSCFYSKWPIHTQTLFTDCHRHCVWCTLCMVYWGLCVQLGTNYIEWTYYLNRMTRCLLAYLFVSEPHALTSCFFPVLHCLSKFYKLWLSEMYKPDSKKVGTLYKLWIKTECNDVEVSNFNILFRIQHRWHIKCLNWENV